MFPPRAKTIKPPMPAKTSPLLSCWLELSKRGLNIQPIAIALIALTEWRVSPYCWRHYAFQAQIPKTAEQAQNFTFLHRLPVHVAHGSTCDILLHFTSVFTYCSFEWRNLQQGSSNWPFRLVFHPYRIASCKTKITCWSHHKWLFHVHGLNAIHVMV